MSTIKLYSAIFGILATTGSCANESVEPLIGLTTPVPGETIYANEYGEIHLLALNDSLMQATFIDEQQNVFDTLMPVDRQFNLLPQDGAPFLRLKTGGLKVYDNRLEAHDFAGPAYMALYSGIEHIYDRPFFRIGDTVSISDVIQHPKGGEQIQGIYILPETGKQNVFAELTGIITREPYPEAYYSNAEDPQGLFTDTHQTHYRLVLKPLSVNVKERYAYTGRTLNLNGAAAFIWDFADSEVFYLDQHAPWNETELDKQLTIEAVLVQFENERSVLKHWQIIE